MGRDGSRALTGALLLLLAAALLVAGAELFVENALAAARRLRVTVLAVGVLLAGAEPEEVLTAVLASVQGHPGLAAGDAVGANVTLLTLTLGLAALLRPVPVGPRVRRYALYAVGGGLLAAVALLDGAVGRVEGAGLVAAYALGVAVVWRAEREPPLLGELAEVEDTPAERSPGVALLLVLVGLGVMTAGGYAAVAGATRVVEALDLTDSAVGLTALALATTAEMFALVVAAARRDLGEVAVAGLVGSAAYNATLTLGAAAVAAPLSDVAVRGPAVLGALLPLVVVAAARRGSLGRGPGALLCVGYLAYLVVVLT